jgi:ABC-2 type transport system permease protein
MRRAVAVAVKELRQIRRDPRTLVILVLVPVFFLFLYGYALNFDIRHIATAVTDHDGSPESRALWAAFERSGYFDVVRASRSDAEADLGFDADFARVVLVIPAE